MPDLSPSRSSPRGRVLLLGLLVTLLVVGVLLLRHFLPTLNPAAPAESGRQRTVTLYFAAANGTGLVAVPRQIPDCPVEEACLKDTVQALIDGPPGDLVPVLPRQTLLRGVALAGSELHVDLSRELVEAHPGGSWGELLTVQALANTLTVSFPHVRQVRILIEGAGVETLKGHVDLRQPINPDFTLVPKVPGGASQTK